MPRLISISARVTALPICSACEVSPCQRTPKQTMARTGLRLRRASAEAAIGNVDAELTKGLDDGQHRAHSGALITVERNVSLGEGCYRRHESHHSSGESDVDDGWSG